MPKRILITGQSLVPQSIVEFLENEGFEVTHVEKDIWTNDELHEALKGVHGYIMGGYEEPTAEHLERAVDLEILAFPGTDYKAYVPGWKHGYDLGIAFVSIPGANSNAVAELTIALLLILYRNLAIRIATRNDAKPYSGSGRDLLGKTIGIIGMGRIGVRVAQIATEGFGMKVVYTSRTRKPGLENKLDYEWTDKNKLLEISDVISLHRPGLQEGENAELGAADIQMMKKGAVLINTVKWNLVDCTALYQALSNEDIAGAAFDGTGKGDDWEMLTSLGTNQFIWFPQTGFNTSDANYRASMAAADAVVKVLRGDTSPLINNPDFLEKRRR